MQLWFEARGARLVATRRAREENDDEPISRRLARLERRLTRPLTGKFTCKFCDKPLDGAVLRSAVSDVAAPYTPVLIEGSYINLMQFYSG